MMIRFRAALVALPAVVVAASALPAQEPDAVSKFPVAPTILVDGAFKRCEGIAFNGEGRLYVAGDAALWHVDRGGTVTKVAEMYSNLGLAPIGERDILMADFGPTNRFDHGPNADGIVWRVSPEGDARRLLDGRLGDPNFLLVLEDGSFLVSDDATDEILSARPDGTSRLFTDAIGHPNGLALSPTGKTLYVAQIFESLRPMVTSGKLWAVPLDEGRLAGTPELVIDFGSEAAIDGLAIDDAGRIYAAANLAGQVWRVDPASGAAVLVAEGMPGAASIAFGAGAFDAESIYVTSTRTGKVWEVNVGARGLPLHHGP